MFMHGVGLVCSLRLYFCQEKKNEKTLNVTEMKSDAIFFGEN